MATALYTTGKTGILSGEIALGSDTIIAILVGPGYTFSRAHANVSQLTNELSGDGYERKTIANKTIDTRVLDSGQGTERDEAYFDFDDLVYEGADFGEVDKVVLAVDGASDSARRLIGCFDPSNITTNGGDLTVQVPQFGVIGLD